MWTTSESDSPIVVDRARTRDASSGPVVTALCRALDSVPAMKAGMLTWDRGPELTRHRESSMQTGPGVLPLQGKLLKQYPRTTHTTSLR
jgi:hypothetical protein